jgi:NAD(P)H-dependent FMN reductase
MEHFLKGYHEVNPTEAEIHYLAQTKLTNEHAAAFEKSSTVILIFPLYTDAMPGIVKLFIEQIAHKKYGFTKQIGFIVQSGFPESNHSLNMERYLKKLAARMECTYIGTLIKGGVEGIQIMPPFMTVKLYAMFQSLGNEFATSGKFNAQIIEKLRKPKKMGLLQRWFFQMGSLTGLANFYWNSNLKKNGAYEKRFAKPYSN